MHKHKLLLFFLIILSFSVAAVPQLPMVVNGDVIVNEKPANVGTKITAEIDGSVVEEFKVFKEGQYLMSIDDGKNGDNVELFVNGIKAANVEYGLEKIEEIDLSVQDNRFLYTFIAIGLILIIGGIILFKFRKIFKKK